MAQAKTRNADVAETISIAKGGTGLTSISALSIWAANSANTLVEVTVAAGQAVRLNAGGTAWEAYTPSAGGGDVTKVGTPVANRMAYWTGDGTLGHEAGFTYDPTTDTLTAVAFAGNLTGNVTGNASGSAATVTTAAQPAITSLGTLTTLTVDNILINGNDISSIAGTDLTITPLAGQQIVLDGTIVIDAGVVTGATSITSTTFVGALTGNADTASAVAVGGITGLGTGVATALAVNVGSAGAFVTFNGALGTPSSGTLTNATGLPIAGLTASTTTAIGVGSVELGHATDTTIARVSAGVISVEGVTIPSISSTSTLTNKRINPRTASTTTASTLTPDLSSANIYYRTTQTETLTIGAPTGTPVIGETILIYVDSAGAQTLTINATYIPFGAAFPATTTAGKTFMLSAQFNGTDWKTLWANAV